MCTIYGIAKALSMLQYSVGLEKNEKASSTLHIILNVCNIPTTVTYHLTQGPVHSMCTPTAPPAPGWKKSTLNLHIRNCMSWLPNVLKYGSFFYKHAYLSIIQNSYCGYLTPHIRPSLFQWKLSRLVGYRD